MTKTLEFVLEHETVFVAANRMRHQNVGFLPVCSRQGRVLGAITDRDIVVRVVADNADANVPVGNVMSRQVISCRPTDDLGRAAALMAEHRKSRVMVMEDGVLLGVISLSDIAQFSESRCTSVLRAVTSRDSRAIR